MNFQSVARKLRKIAQEMELEETGQSAIQWQIKLPEQLRELREQHGLTLRQVESQCGVSNAYLSLLENGKNEPTVGTLMKILQVYGLKLAIVPID